MSVVVRQSIGGIGDGISPGRWDSYEPSLIEPHWQQIWRERPGVPAHERGEGLPVVVGCPIGSRLDLEQVRTLAIADAHARFRRAREGSASLSLCFVTGEPPYERSADERAQPIHEWLAVCTSERRAEIEQLGVVTNGACTLYDERDVDRWLQSLFLLLFDANLIDRRDHTAWSCERCGAVADMPGTSRWQCESCDGNLRPARRVGWFLGSTSYNRENELCLDELHGWNRLARDAQRATIGAVGGVELDARTLDGRSLTVFTPYADAVAQTEFVMLSPNHPDVKMWLDTDVGDTHGVQGYSGSGPIVFPTGVLVVVAGVDHMLPVVVTPAVDERFGPTATLAIPAVDDMDREIAARIGALASPVHVRDNGRPTSTAQAWRYGACDRLISSEHARGVPIPVVHCQKCGPLGVRREELPVTIARDLTAGGQRPEASSEWMRCECPSCGGDARRDAATLGESVERAWRELLLIGLAQGENDGGSQQSLPVLCRRLQAGIAVQSVSDADATLIARATAKALRDLEVCEFEPSGEPFATVVSHEPVGRCADPRAAHAEASMAAQEAIERYGADIVRLAILHAAAPERRIGWNGRVLPYFQAFFGRLWVDADTWCRSVAIDDCDRGIDASDPLRRRLVAWCNTAIYKMTQNMEAFEMHRAVRNIMLLLDRIEEFQRRAEARPAGADALDRQATMGALVILLRLLAPVAPHVAQEICARAEARSAVTEMPWPEMIEHV